MYEIKIKGKADPIIVDDNLGVKIKDMFLDDVKFPETQKIGIKNWIGTKSEIKTVFHVTDSSEMYESEKEFDPSVLKNLEKELVPFMVKRKRPNGPGMFDYLTRENELMFLEKKGAVRIENIDKYQFRVTNPKLYFGWRELIMGLFALYARRENASKKNLENLGKSIENIGEIPA